MITFCDCMPMMADVISGAVPRPRWLAAGEDVLTWARETPAIRTLCARWGVDVGALRVGRGDSAPVGASWALLDALGDGAAVVHLGGRLIALNVDGTRCAYYTAGEGGER